MSQNPFEIGDTIRGYASGQVVFERYELKKILGRGGMGVVWLAYDQKLEEEVALKFLPETVRMDQTALKDLVRETKRSRELTHPGIIRIHDLVDDGESAAIVMEYVDGVTLQQKRHEHPDDVVKPEFLEEILPQVCEALDYAHTVAKIVHRDLKPANIMVTKDGRAKLADFGVARSLCDTKSRMTQIGASAGTMAYMSPQQLMGERPQAADDIYALGATMHELLVSEPPFHSGEIGMQIQHKQAPNINEEREHLGLKPIDKKWGRVVSQCLEKSPAGRPETASSVVGLLNGISEVIPQAKEETKVKVAPRVTPAKKSAEGGGKGKTVLIAAATMVILSAVGGVAYMAGQGSSEEPTSQVTHAETKQEVAETPAPQSHSVEKLVTNEESLSIEHPEFSTEVDQVNDDLEEAYAIYENEKKYTQRFIESIDLDSILQLAENGDAKAQFIYGRIHDENYGGNGSNTVAVKWYQMAADQDYAGAQCNLGVCYEYGRGVGKDEVEGVKWYRKAAAQGYARAQCNLAVCYANGTGVSKDQAEGVKWYRKAADQGFAKAQFDLGVRYDEGRGVGKDEVEAVEWYRKAAVQGYARAQCNLGVCYANGIGVSKDQAEAVKWYRKAAEQGFTIAQNNLGVCYAIGQGVSKDQTEAVKWYRKAADQGYPSAQYNLGVRYSNGEGVSEDQSEAVKWYLKAAKQGNADAQYSLGMAYQKGKGVLKDEALGFNWFRKAAEGNHIYSIEKMGGCYFYGKGVIQDREKAVYWYKKAAELGDDRAQYNLAVAYYRGFGVKRNKQKAIEWAKKSAKQGYRGAGDLLKTLGE